MLSIVKFYTNRPDDYRRNRVFSRTLCKIAVVDNEWTPADGRRPAGSEFWLVDVVKESSPGKPRGAFVVRPVRYVAREQHDGSLDSPIMRLLPGMFTSALVYPGGSLGAGVVVITPRHQDTDWIFGMDAARLLIRAHNAYALVVNLGGEQWSPTAGGGTLSPRPDATIMVTR